MEYIIAFFVGGLICAAGQILIDKTKMTPARIVVLFVVLGVIFTGLGIYDKLVEFASSGVTVPITGFGYSLAKGVEAAIDKYGFIGIFIGGLTATAGGISAAIFFGYLFSLFFKSKMK